MDTTRRRLLAVGLAGTALLGLGGGLGWLTLGYSVPEGDVPIALSTKELAIVRAIVDAVLPGGEGLPSGLELGVHQRIDEEIWSAPEAVASDLKAALHLLEHLPPVFGFAGRFSGLSREDREACVTAYLRASQTVVVQAAVGLKQMCMLFGYTNDRSWKAIGYDGPLVNRQRPPPTSVAYAALLDERRTG